MGATAAGRLGESISRFSGARQVRRQACGGQGAVCAEVGVGSTVCTAPGQRVAQRVLASSYETRGEA